MTGSALPETRTALRRAARWLTVAVLAAALAGCKGRGRATFEIEETREVGAQAAIPEDVTTAERLGLARTARSNPAMVASSSPLTWDLPEGWRTGAARPMRIATFFGSEDDSLECYIAELMGGGGGMKANFDRWRAQLGQAPLTNAEFGDLPTVTVMGAQMPLLEAAGTYRGMGQDNRPNSKLLGTMVAVEGRTYFIKMVGPAAAVDGAREDFLAFAESLRAAAP